jgi:hypothetical protein
MMKINFLAGVLGATLTLSPLGLAQQQRHADSDGVRADSDGVRQAVAFQRTKDRQDARQAKLEQRHPSVNYSNADRSMEDSGDGHRVPDSGPAVPHKNKK